MRRGFIAEKYAVLIDALYAGKKSQFIETQVKFEDGRTGTISADLRIRDAAVYSPGRRGGVTPPAAHDPPTSSIPHPRARRQDDHD